MRWVRRLGALLGIANLVFACAAPGSAWAQSHTPESDTAQGDAAHSACGHVLSEAVYGAWRDLGGETGRLGCAAAPETATSTSPQGSRARAAVFDQNGEIILHASGPRAGQAYAVWGCFYRLYVQFGGTSGWLGLPIGEAENIPDGSRQAFEGGAMRYTRAYDTCEATPASPPSPAAAAPVSAEAGTALDVFENPATGDRLSLAAGGSVQEAMAAGYQRLRGQARVMSETAAGATRLKLYANDATGLKATVATAQSERDLLAGGYAFEAGQGFVWTDPRPGAVMLKQFRDPASGRIRLTAGPQDESEAAASGYRFVRIEGYADPAP